MPPALEFPHLGSRASLRERIRDSLRAAVISGSMVPGKTYSVPNLAERFGVSATPVREAMLDLTKEGMVEPVPNKGFRVTEVSEQDLDEVTEIRQMLEVPTVGKLARRLSAVELSMLRSLADRIQEAADNGDLIHYVDADRRFHLTLLGLAGNRRLVQIVEELRDRTRLFGLERLAAGGQLTRSAAEHHDLLQAFEDGASRGQIEKILAHHIGHVRGIWANRNDIEAGAAPSPPAGSSDVVRRRGTGSRSRA